MPLIFRFCDLASSNIAVFQVPSYPDLCGSHVSSIHPMSSPWAAGDCHQPHALPQGWGGAFFWKITWRQPQKWVTVNPHVYLLCAGVPGFCSKQGSPVSLIGGYPSQPAWSSFGQVVHIPPALPSGGICAFV